MRNLSFPRKAKQWKDGKGIQGVQENYYNDESEFELGKETGKPHQ